MDFEHVPDNFDNSDNDFRELIEIG